MRGLNPEQIKRKILKDVVEIKKSAAFVLELSEDNRVVSFDRNPKPSLNVIAVIGSPNVFSSKSDEVVVSISNEVEKALLIEVGIGATYPYHGARRLNRQLSESYEIIERAKRFNLSTEQYQLVAPVIFELVEILAYQKVIGRKWGQYSTPFVYSFLRKYYAKSKGKTVERWASLRIAEQSAKFSISNEDKFFLQDVCWAELNLNTQLKNKLKTLLNFIDLRINAYRHSYKGVRDFQELYGVKDIQEIVRKCSFSNHLLIELIRRLKDEKKNPRWSDIAFAIDVDSLKSEEQALSKDVLPSPVARLRNIQLRITTEAAAGKDHIVFEVFPRDFRKEK